MKQAKQQKQQVFDVSVALSFVVAIFAIFTVASFGLDMLQGGEVSYAISPTEETLTFYKLEQNGQPYVAVIGTYSLGDQSKRFVVPLYFSDEARQNPVFCVEKGNANTVTGTIYRRDGIIDDYGLLYLMDNSFMNGKRHLENADDYFEIWFTQAAIWLYLSETKPNEYNTISADELAVLESVDTLSYSLSAPLPSVETYTLPSDSSESIYSILREFVDEAKGASSVKKLSVTKASDAIAKSSDGKHYRSSLITVKGNPQDDLISYDVKLSGISGAIAIDESGQIISLENVSPNTKFYVAIPAENVTEKVQTLRVSVTGHFSTLTGHYYAAESGDFQRIVSVTGANKDENAGIDFEFVGAPDTGMSLVVKRLYLVGLIIFICGVSVIFAVARQQQVQQ